MAAFVVDSNVLSVANRRTPHASGDCVRASTAILADIIERHLVVIDAHQEIFGEYLRNAHRRGQPGVGDAFVKWLWDHQADVQRCEQVRLTRAEGSPDYAEFPASPDLDGFDRDDRVFVAVAIASVNQPTVANAVDTDWHFFRDALERAGVVIEFLCPEHMHERR